MAKAEVTWVFTLPGSAIEYQHRGPTFTAATKNWVDTKLTPTFVRKEWDKVAWPGLYPLYYVTKDNGCLCPKCANENIELTLGDDPQWKIEEVEANMESTSLYCDNCNNFIPTAYGDDQPENGD